MNIYTIYKATNSINGKSYIGFDSNWPNRKKDHEYQYKKGKTKFYSAIISYGFHNFTWEILYQSKDKDHTLNQMENYFICEHKTYIGLSDCNGYNMTLGGESGFGQNVTKETIHKAKQTNKLIYGNENYNNKEQTLKTMNEKYGCHSSQRKFSCPYCGKNATLSHQQLCKNNSDRKLPNKSGEKHFKSKEILILNKTTGEISTIKGNLKKFCKENNISYFKLWNKTEKNFLRLD